MSLCPICMQFEFKHRTMDDGTEEVECSRCGRFRVVTGSAVASIRNTKLTPRQRSNFSSWLFENPGFVINAENFNNLISKKEPNFHSRGDNLLIQLEKETGHLGEFLEWNPGWLASSWSIDDEEMAEILNYLIEECLVQRSEASIPDKSKYKLAPAGWKRLEDLKAVNPGSNQCFVAMWFDDEMCPFGKPA